MTSNIGSEVLLEAQGKIDEEVNSKINEMMRYRFKPEFLNRVDDIIMFKPLQKDEIKKIIDIFMRKVKERLEEKNISLEITEEAKDLIVDIGYDSVYGARPLKRYISNTLETQIAKRIIAGNISDGDSIRVEVEDGNVVIK